MPIHYVDPLAGNDSSDGSSWAQAWKTCHPLGALYGSQGLVSNLEVRIAKTPPADTGVRFMFAPADRRQAPNYTKPAILGINTLQSRLLSWGGTAIAPFTGDGDEGTSSPYRPQGTYKFRIDAPAMSSGLAARWPLTDGDFSAFQCFEVIAAFYFRTDKSSDCPAEAWLEFATDSAGTNIVWSRKIDAGSKMYEARMSLLGNNDLPASASYVFIRINNPTDSIVHLDCSPVYAVLPLTHPHYVGYRMMYVPEGKLGTAFTPKVIVKESGQLICLYSGMDQANMDATLDSNGLPVRTWSMYTWEPYPYEPKPILDACSTAGSSDNPIKMYGGWNKDTGVMDGLSVIDAANIRLFRSVRQASVDIRNVGLPFRRSGQTGNNITVPGIMEYTGYSVFGKEIKGCRADGVVIPGSGAGCVGEIVAYAISDFVRESLLNVGSAFGGYAVNTASFANCNTFFSVPFGGAVNFSSVEDSTWSTDMIRTIDRRNFRVKRCVLVNPRWSPAIGGNDFDELPDSQGRAPTYDDCDIIQCGPENSYGNDYASAPKGWLENCRLWGPYTGPVSAAYACKNLTYTPFPGMPGPICASGADIDGLVITDASVLSTDSMFARTAYNADSVTVTLKNANVQMIFANFVPVPGQYDYKGHSVTLENVTLHKTPASVGAPFRSARLNAKTLTMSGAWSAVQEGIIRETSIDTLVFTDSSSKIVDNFRFSAPAAGWGRVCAYYNNIVHPLGLDGFLGTPSNGYECAGAAWFGTLDGEMWASHVLSVRRDKTVSHSGLSSWKMSSLQPLGAISLGSFLVGTAPVVAGVPVTFSAYMKRDTKNVLGGLFIRPAATREFSAPDEVDAPSLFDVVVMQDVSAPAGSWAKVTVTYTPYRDGLVELHAGLRGMPGSSVWLDTMKVSQ